MLFQGHRLNPLFIPVTASACTSLDLGRPASHSHSRRNNPGLSLRTWCLPGKLGAVHEAGTEPDAQGGGLSCCIRTPWPMPSHVWGRPRAGRGTQCGPHRLTQPLGPSFLLLSEGDSYQPKPCLFPPQQSYCLAPFDLIKVRLQNQTESRVQPRSPPPRYRGPVHCAATIFREEGPRGLFRGAWTLMLRDTPTLGIYFVTYEGLCRQYTPDGQNPSK